MKKEILSFLTISLLLLTYNNYAQKFEQRQLGNVSLDELKMTHYKLDSTAKAVVIENYGHVYFNKKNDDPRFIKKKYRGDFYLKIKVFKKDNFDYGKIKFRFTRNSNLSNVEGVTYNIDDNGKIEKSILNPDDIVSNKIDRTLTDRTLVLPNVKDGSVLEYKYTIYTNNYGVYDWYFQREIPTIKSVYLGKVSTRDKFNLKKTGKFNNGKLITEARKSCVGNEKCLAIEQTMSHIPALKTEDYMLDEKNYKASLQFERNYIDGYTKKGANRDWKATDKILKSYYSFKSNEADETRKKLPSYLFTEVDDLQRAKKIYYYIQSNYKSWNISKIYSSGRSINKTLNEKNGSRSNINFILFNALKAAKLNPEMVFLSTRDELIVSKLHASLVDFNHIIVKLQLNENDYFLDPSYKNLPFGLPSFMSLNGDGRAFNFKNYSQWTSIYPTNKSSISKTTDLLVKKDGTIKGKLTVKTIGYESQSSRNSYFKDNEENYLEAFETQYSNVIVKNYTNKNSKNLDKPFIETYDIEIEEEEDTFDKIVLPVFSSFISNPFQLEKREYAINFGYSRDYTHRIQLRFEDNVTFKRLPKNFGYKLPNNGGRLIFSIAQGENRVNIYLKLSLKKPSYPASEYEYLKEFFAKFIEKKNEYIQLQY